MQPVSRGQPRFRTRPGCTWITKAPRSPTSRAAPGSRKRRRVDHLKGAAKVVMKVTRTARTARRDGRPHILTCAKPDKGRGEESPVIGWQRRVHRCKSCGYSLNIAVQTGSNGRDAIQGFISFISSKGISWKGYRGLGEWLNCTGASSAAHQSTLLIPRKAHTRGASEV